MRRGIDNVGHILDELARDWHVELNACERLPVVHADETDTCRWRLTLIPRSPRAFGAHTYVGSLVEVLTRAFAGERADSISR